MKLPNKMGYGMSVSLERGVALFMGGKNGEGELDCLIKVEIDDGELSVEEIGKLPSPMAE